MLFELQLGVSGIVEGNYVTLVILIAIGYDYILTFSDEIEYVWNKPWTPVSTLFILVRYIGLCGVIIATLVGCSFLPVPAELRFQGKILCMFSIWAMVVFLGSADLAMILRIWAMYTRSRMILGILLTLYIMEMVSFVIACIVMSTKFTAVTIQVLDFSFCVPGADGGSATWAEVNSSLQLALAATMCLLVTVQFIQHSLQIYKATQQWQPGRYMSLFVKDGMLYFLAILLFGIFNVLIYGPKVPTTGWRGLLIGILGYVPVFTLTPRFILSVRALYARDLRGRCGPCDMDTEFGFASVDAHSIFKSAIVFRQDASDVTEQKEGIPMREREIRRAGGGV